MPYIPTQTTGTHKVTDGAESPWSFVTYKSATQEEYDTWLSAEASKTTTADDENTSDSHTTGVHPSVALGPCPVQDAFDRTNFASAFHAHMVWHGKPPHPFVSGPPRPGSTLPYLTGYGSIQPTQAQLQIIDLSEGDMSVNMRMEKQGTSWVMKPSEDVINTTARTHSDGVMIWYDRREASWKLYEGVLEWGLRVPPTGLQESPAHFKPDEDGRNLGLEIKRWTESGEQIKGATARLGLAYTDGSGKAISGSIGLTVFGPYDGQPIPEGTMQDSTHCSLKSYIEDNSFANEGVSDAQSGEGEKTHESRYDHDQPGIQFFSHRGEPLQGPGMLYLADVRNTRDTALFSTKGTELKFRLGNEDEEVYTRNSAVHAKGVPITLACNFPSPSTPR